MREEGEVTVSVGDDSSLRGFLFVCYMVTPSLMAHVTTRRLSHIFSGTSTPNCVSLSGPSFVSTSVSASGVGGQTKNSCWLKHEHSGCGRTETSEYENSGQGWAASLGESVFQGEDPFSEVGVRECACRGAEGWV